MSAREDARRAWREAVNAAARAWSKADRHRHFRGASIVRSYRDTAGALTHELTFKVYGALEDALSAPKPWRSKQRPDPRRRYSRAHRRGCKRCRAAWIAKSDGRPFGWTCTWRRIHGYAGFRTLVLRTVFVRYPHGWRA